MKEWRTAIISAIVSVLLATGAASLEWSYKAGVFETRLNQTQEQVQDIRDLTTEIKTMNGNMLIMQTEMKYYRRDIDEVRRKQDEISNRLDHVSDDPSRL